ncbi:fibronectin type III domain-containing protein [Paenibacillus pasadenensis]|uniref:sugar-binding protein n=1 Tax=Paenibacillus pasadenensis TaxID=217090 RepID=UPI00203A8044|nr:sugar-binding protein [Paenibacillus pasadenensis]MCM3746596.1 fibronectin type III domain-containing protein [Paenibacillus pasadenensis]
MRDQGGSLRRKPSRYFMFFFLVIMYACMAPSAHGAQQEGYNWQNVSIGGGGFVTGMAIHPTEPDLVYIRTDVGGAYRWDETNKKWIQLLNALPREKFNLYGIDSIAIDPSDPDVVYVAAGKFNWPGAASDILKSTDRGATWEPTGFIPQNFGNGTGRDAGERLAVDPNNGQIVYMGTRTQGLWLSTSGASNGSWQQVSAFPVVGTSPFGLNFVVFDKNTGTSGNATQTIYVGVEDGGVYRSTDGGTSWAQLSGSPLKPNRAAVAANGTLYVSHETGVAKFAGGAWTDISPPAAGKYSGMTVDPANSNVIMTAVATGTNFPAPIYRSTNGGADWTQVSFVKHPDVPWWTSNWFAANTASLTIDPLSPDRVWLTDFFGIWRTDSITASPSHWYSYENGHEEVVNFALRSTPIGAPLLSGHADVDGMRHTSLSTFPSSKFGGPTLGDTVSIDFQESNPNFVARVGSTRYQNSGGGGYSTDNGATWTAFPNPPGIAGRIAVSAASETMVWIPQYGSPLFSTDRGQSWTPSSGAPSGTVHDFWVWYQPLASDRVNNNTFYLLERATSKFYRSTDGGESFSYASTMPSSTASLAFFSVKAAPGMAGEVWVGLDSGGLMRSSNSGDTWTPVPGVQQAKLFAFGKNRLGSPYPTVFVYGKVDNAVGIFRSDDFGATWVKIDVLDPAIGDEANTMEGDRQVWGRVYIGTNGTGVFYGDSLTSEGSDTDPPSTPTGVTSLSQTATTIKLAWTASTDNTGVAGYNIYNGGVFAGSTTSLSSTSFVVNGLAPSTAYSFTVKAKDGAGNLSAASSALSVTTSPPPAAPTNVASTSTTMTSIGLSWNAPSNLSGVAGYKIYSGSALAGSTTGTAYTLSGLLPDRTYALTVRSFDSAGALSSPSGTLSVTTAAGPGTLSFTDDFQDGTADGWSVTNGTWSVVSSGGSKVYKQSAWMTVNAFSTVDASTFTNYSVDTSIKLTQNDIDLAAGITARYQDPNNFYYFRIKAGKLQIGKSVNGTVTILAQKNYPMTTNVVYTFTAVLNNSTLDFYVNGFKELSVSDTSHTSGKIGLYAFKTGVEFDNVKVIQNRDFAPPAAPGNLTLESKGETTARLSWSASTDNVGVTGYEVYNGSTLAGTVTSTTYTVTGLAADSAYSFTVRAKDAAGNVSAASAPLAVTTDPYLVGAKKTLAAVTVDGALNESMWSMVKQANKAIIGSPDNTAQFGVLWDNNYLYVGVEVADGNLYNTSVLPYYDDSVEIYIDGNHNKGSAYDSHDRQYVKGWNDSALWEQKGKTTGVLHGWAAKSGGYSVELAIPWSELGVTPSAGMTIGFDVAGNDTDNGSGRQSQLMWAGTNDNWTNTSAFGSLVLSSLTVGDAQAPTAPLNLASPSHTDRTVNLSWTASTDNVGVAGYEIYSGENLVATVTSTTYTVTGLTPNASYTFSVKAKDAEHNVSAASNTVSVTTDESYTLIHAVKTNAAITVDGSLNEQVWSLSKQANKAVSGTANNTTTFGVLWDDNYLYVAASVIDGNLANNSAEPYADDSVEIYVDGNYNRGTVYDSFDRQFIKGWNDSSLFEARSLTSGVLHAWSATTAGYSVELAIPWSSLGITPSAGMTIGFDVANNDEDDGNGRQSQTVWAGTADNWTNTFSFGELYLQAP